jgi:hypothetical protein
MKTRAFLAATAALVTSFQPIVMTPAYADAIDDPQAFCEDQLKPNDPNSEFQTEPVGLIDSGWVDDGPAYPDTPAGDPEGYGTPTGGVLTFNGTYIRHGGSPNVWGGATTDLVYPQTRQLFNFKKDQTQTLTFGCHVWKETPGGLVEPPGLQTVGNVITNHQTIDAGQDYVITDDDFIVPGVTVDVLICISPNNITKSKPGTWRQMHGFTGSCTAASTAAGTSFIPSHNNPTTDPDISF